MKRIRIPDEDVLVFDEEIEVMQTRTFQRLFFLKQLGLAYLVYPAATHVRGAHSIQCLHEAQKILTALESPSYHVSDEDRREIRMAALLHDIGHIPFSHTLEDEHQILPKHDSNRLGRALDLLTGEVRSTGTKELVARAGKILYAIAKVEGYPRDWKSDIVGNTVCADLLAYINADAQWTGIEKRAGYYRMFEYFRVHGNRLCICLTKNGELRTDILSAIEDVLDMRYALTERVIFHHAKCVASAMLARAAMLCNLKETPELLSMGDDVFLNYLGKISADSNSPGALRLLEGLRSRRLYKRIFKIDLESRAHWEKPRRNQSEQGGLSEAEYKKKSQEGANPFSTQWRKIEEVRKLLDTIEDSHELPQGSLVLWCSDPKAGRKLVEVQVIWENADGIIQGPIPLREAKTEFDEVDRRVKRLEERYDDLWKLWIAMDPEQMDKAAYVVRSLEQKLDIPCSPLFLQALTSKLDGFKEKWAEIKDLEERAAHELSVGADHEAISKQGVIPFAQPSIPFDENKIRMAAKNTAQVSTQRHSEMRSALLPGGISDKDMFWSVFHKDPDSKTWQPIFKLIETFLHDEHRGSFQNNRIFLERIRDSGKKSFTTGELRDMLREEIG